MSGTASLLALVNVSMRNWMSIKWEVARKCRQAEGMGMMWTYWAYYNRMLPFWSLFYHHAFYSLLENPKDSLCV